MVQSNSTLRERALKSIPWSQGQEPFDSTVAARRIEDHSRLVPQDKEARTVVMRLSGADLHAFLAGQISREEARKRVDIREF